MAKSIDEIQQAVMDLLAREADYLEMEDRRELFYQLAGDFQTLSYVYEMQATAAVQPTETRDESKTDGD